MVGLIKVTDKLPRRKANYSFSNDVLVFDGENFYTAYYSYSSGKWYSVETDNVLLGITYWGFLPSKPKEV